MPPEPMRPLPTAAELDKLAVAYRDNPRSTAFLPLAEAYLALGRPRDAMEALSRGLANHPEHAEARLALGRSHVLLHQWKEAQVELLKVVKLDRQSREGFRLLGEVLMRRQDFERALPVLQHATNLDPADPKVLSMLRRAREGRPLDPPPPTPTALVPAGSSGGAAKAPARSSFSDSEATQIADDEYRSALGDDGARGDSEPSLDDPTSLHDGDGPPRRSPPRLTGPPPPVAPPRSPPRSSAAPPPPPPSPGRPAPPAARSSQDDVLARMAIEKQQARAAEERVSRRVADDRAAEPVPARRRNPVPPPEDPFRPITDRKSHGEELIALANAEPPLSAALDGPPRPPVNRPAERPRGVQAAPGKSKDLGAGDMRRSAAMSEDYLNQLLLGGLLSVPNVEARDSHTDPEMQRKWRRKTRNAFIVLFVLLTLGAGGAGGYVYYSNKQRDEAVAAHLEAARVLIAMGRQVDLTKAAAELRQAYQRNPASTLVIATLAQAAALDFYLYGAGTANEVESYVSATSKRLRDVGPGAVGQREFAIALAARNLSLIDQSPAPAQVIAETRTALDAQLTLAPGDGMLLYLDGALRLALGDREGARAAYEKADTGGNGPAIARIAIGDLLLDDGDAKGAQTAYEAALERSAQHPLALIGRALARVERSTDAEAAMQDLNVGLSGATGARVLGWKHLAMATVWAYLEDYEKAQTELDAAQKSALPEPRFQARIALALLKRGKVVDAGELRQKIRYYGDAPGRDPMLMLLDAELFMASGMPEDALAAVGENPTLRARLLRGRALIDQGKPDKALAEFAAALVLVPDDAMAKAFRELAQVLVSVSGTERGKGAAAFDALAKLARGSVSGLVRYVLAEADLALGKTEDARRDLEASLEGDNPLAYRALTRLAEVYLVTARTDDAEKALRQGLLQSPLYVPAHAALGRILLQKGKTAEAVQELEAPVSAGRASPADLLAYASALVTLGRKEEAKDPLKRARAAGAPADQVGAIAGQIDPAFAEELGVPVPEKAPSAPKRRGRRGR